MTENTKTLINNHLEISVLKQFLFASGTPILISQLSEALNVPIKEIEVAINILEQDLKSGRRN